MFSLCVFLAASQIVKDAMGTPIPVHHSRPSALLKSLDPVFQSENVVTADDDRGLLYVRAGAEVTRHLRTLVATFDVAPARVRLRIERDSPIDKETGFMETEVANNSSFRFGDARSGIELVATPRINADGSVTIALLSEYRESKVTVVFRCEKGKTVALRLGRSGGIVSDDPPRGERGGLPWPTLRFSAAAVRK